MMKFGEAGQKIRIGRSGGGEPFGGGGSVYTERGAILYLRHIRRGTAIMAIMAILAYNSSY